MTSNIQNPLLDEAACALRDLWNRTVRDRLSTLSKNPTKILVLLEENGLFPPLYTGEQYRNTQILALALLFRENQIEFPDTLKDSVQQAVSNELHRDRLEEWTNKTERKAHLIALCNELGIGVPKATKPSKGVLVECDNIRDLLKKIELWRNDFTAWEREYPRFCRILDALIENQLGWEYDKAYLDAARQRLTLLSFYLASILNLPREATQELLNRASGFVWPGVFDPKTWKP